MYAECFEESLLSVRLVYIMAANIVNMSKLGLVLVVLATSGVFRNALGQNVTIDANDTTIAPTTQRTTRATTTTISPSGSGTNIPDSTDVSLCPCDLTGNGCDVNCCCDPDCSDVDKSVFSECTDNSYTLDDKLCFDRNVFFADNGPTQTGDVGNLFCVYFDNDEDRNYYNNPSLVTTEAEFFQLSGKTRTFSFQSQPSPLTVSSYSPYYRSGDPIYTVFPNGYFSYLGLPTSVASSSVCADSNPAAFFIDQSNTCGRFITNLATECTTLDFLKASTFYQDFRVVKDPFLLQSFNETTTVVDPVLGSVNLADVTELYNNSYTAEIVLDPVLNCVSSTTGLTAPCAFTTVPNPLYTTATSTCRNVVVGVHYKLVTYGVFGVESVTVSLTFADITTTSLTQTFSTSFSTVSSRGVEAVPRSGNPGYDVGQPIIAGVFNITNDGSNTVEEMLLIQERGQQMALVKPLATGDCVTSTGQPREPVLFGEDMRTGCFLTVSTTSNCFLLQQEIIKAVEGYAIPTFDPTTGYAKNYRYVAMFGNSDNRKTGDWVEIFYKGRPEDGFQQGSDCRLSTSANIQILYANIGALANPQAKILGVSYIYDAAQVVQYQCTGATCQPGRPSLTQRLEVSTSVTFIDVSDPPEGVEGRYPTVPARLPYDFFYPFTDAAPCVGHLSLSLWAVCAFVIVNAVL